MSEFIAKSRKLGLWNGATVEVTSIPKADYVAGWDNYCAPEMVDEIGKQFVVNYCDGDGISGSDSDYFWPWWSLKLVKAAPEDSTQNSRFTDTYGPYAVGQKVYVGEDAGTILEFDHDKNLIHVDIGDDDTYWFNYFDVSETIARPVVRVSLNSEYDAVVDTDKRIVTVGCQEIDFDKVLELADKLRKVK